MRALSADNRNSRRRIWKWRVLAFVFVAVVICLLGLHAGQWLDVSSSPSRADYAYVLPGEENSRPFVAALLYRQGLVPKILVPENELVSAQLKGLLPSTGQVIVAILRQRGVPQEDIILLGGTSSNSWDDLAILARFLQQHPKATVLLVTNSFHTRRCRWILRQQLGRQADRVSFVAAPLEGYDGLSWWQNRFVATTIAGEYLKLLYYWIRYGLGAFWIGGIASVLILVWLRRRSTYFRKNFEECTDMILPTCRRRVVVAIWLPVVLAGQMTVGKAEELRVMSYNIRYGTAPDGENHWDFRKDFLVHTIRQFDPDLLGTQETLAFQRDFLAEKLHDYEVLGVGRDDGKEQGEMVAIFWRRERFEPLENGHFWLSPNPEVPGSRGWDAALPRMVTWVKLQDRLQPEAPPILWMNTHLDHRGRTAREESAKLLRIHLEKSGQGCSLVITGDFNAAEGSEPYQILFGIWNGQIAPIVDCYRVVHPERKQDEGTFSGFRVDNVSGPRIDWIACSRDWKVLAAGIDRTARAGRTPSDHFAVYAVLRR